MTTPDKARQGALEIASIDPAVSVLAATFSRALVNAVPFCYSDKDCPPEWRSVRLRVNEERVLTVTATDHVTAFYQPVDTMETPVDVDCLIDREDAVLMAAAIRGALRTAVAANETSARIRLVELHSETLLRLDVGSRRIDLVTVGVAETRQRPDVVPALRKSAETGEVGSFDVVLNAKLLARMARITVEFKDQAGQVTMTQVAQYRPVRCELPDGIVVLVMPIRPQDEM